MTVPNEAPPQLMAVSTTPARPPQSGWAAVYRLYDKDGALLYIGSTNQPAMRWSRHGERQPWWHEVDAYTLEWWPDRTQAFTEEFKAIRAEAPRYNKRMLPRASDPQLTAGVADEEVQRVFDALDDVERIADPEARSRAQVRITATTRKRAAKWHAERAELAQRLKAEGESVRGIAKRLGVKPGTVQDLLRGYKGSGRDRPPAEEQSTADATDEE